VCNRWGPRLTIMCHFVLANLPLHAHLPPTGPTSKTNDQAQRSAKPNGFFTSCTTKSPEDNLVVRSIQTIVSFICLSQEPTRLPGFSISRSAALLCFMHSWLLCHSPPRSCSCHHHACSAITAIISSVFSLPHKVLASSTEAKLFMGYYHH
jgi:hypothetical protein